MTPEFNDGYDSFETDLIIDRIVDGLRRSSSFGTGAAAVAAVPRGGDSFLFFTLHASAHEHSQLQLTFAIDHTAL